MLNLINYSLTESRSTSSGQFGRTGAFRIWREYSLLRNHLASFYFATEHKNGLQVRNGSIPFHPIPKPNTPSQREGRVLVCLDGPCNTPTVSPRANLTTRGLSKNKLYSVQITHVFLRAKFWNPSINLQAPMNSFAHF